MPFRSALSAGNQTTKRGGVYSAIRYVAALTPTIQLQFNPSVAANGKPAAQITRSTQLSGSHNNLLYGMTVYITPSSNYLSDLKNRPEDCLKTYVREVAPTSTLLYIGLTAFQWTTSHFVTVVDNFEVFQKKTRIVNGVIYKNVDLTYRAPLPRISGVYATLAMTHTPNANVSPTPTETAMTSGASISSRTWATIENGVVTKAVSTSATPTFNLDLGIHWLHLTTTDSGGRANWFAFLVVVCPYNMASVVSKLVAGSVTNDLNAGISADIQCDAAITTLVPGAAALIFDDLTYRDGTIEQVVKAFGWLDSDVHQEISGDESYGVRTTYNTRLVGVRDAANTVRLPGMPFKFKASPTTWGQVARCTVYDAIWYAANEHSTVANLAAFDFPTNYTDYQYNPSLQIPEGVLFDSLDTLAFFASGGMVNYSPNGELFFRQSLLYDTSTSSRNAATVYGTYTTGDAAVSRLNRPPVNKFPLSAIQGGFATWNTTTNTPRAYQSIAPQEQTPAALLESVDGIILTKNLTDTNAKAEAGKLAVNHFFASTQPSGVSGDFLGGYTTLEASCFQWHKFSIDSDETLDGIVYDSDTRFLCTQVVSDYNADEWGIVVNAEFREETDGGDNYARETEFIPLGTNQPYPTYPLSEFSPFLEDFATPSDHYGDEYDDQRQGWEDPTLPPETAKDNANENTGVVAKLLIPFKGGAIGTAFNTTLGQSYLIRATGFARITAASSNTTYNFAGSAQGWSALTNADSDVGTDARPKSGQPAAGTNGGTGWTHADYEQQNSAAGQSVRAVYIHIDLSSPITVPAGQTVTVTFDYTKGVHTGGLTAWRIQTKDSAGTWSIRANVTGAGTTDGTDRTITWTASTDTTIHGIAAWVRADSGHASPSGSVLVKSVVVGVATALTYGDSFFTWTADDEEGVAYSGSNGLNQDGAGIVHANAFNPAHVYEYTTTGTGNPFTFSFTDPDGNYADNENKVIQIEVIEL